MHVILSIEQQVGVLWHGACYVLDGAADGGKSPNSLQVVGGSSEEEMKKKVHVVAGTTVFTVYWCYGYRSTLVCLQFKRKVT